MSEFRGRGSRGSRGMRGSRGSFMRGGPPRSSSRGGYSGDRDGPRGGLSRGRGDGFSRGRGGPPRHMSRDGSPPRKVPMMSRGYDSDRGRGPPMDRRFDRYDDGYDRSPPPRARDLYSSPPRDTGRLMGRLTPPRSSIRDRDHGLPSRGSDYPSSRDYLSARSYSPPRDSGYRDSYGSGLREERRDSFARPIREYPSQRSSIDYAGDRSRDFRDSPRDYPLSGRGEFRDRFHDRDHGGNRDARDGGFDNTGDREYPSSRLMSRQDVRVSSREYGGRGGPRGGRDDRGGSRGSRGSFLNGSRGRGGPPRGRGRSSFRGSRRSPPPGRDDPIVKRPRMEGGDSYSRR